MSDVFIGRQPIFDADLQVCAYELLFRSSKEGKFAGVVDGDQATSQVFMNAFIDIGLYNLVGKKKAFFNLTRHYLTTPDLVLVPPEQVVLEVLEDIVVDRELVDAVSKLKKRGYTIALDDIALNDLDVNKDMQDMISMAEIIKIDCLELSQTQVKEHVEFFNMQNVDLLAEKIETREEFNFYKKLGFKFFQGHFLSRPTVIEGKGIAANKMAIMSLVQEVYDPDMDINSLSELVSRDVSLSHKVLRYINSAASGLSRSIDSISQAVVMLGIRIIRNWVTIMALAQMDDTPSELSTMSLVRGRICEMLAKESAQLGSESFFTVGLFSTLDAMLAVSMSDALESLPLATEVKSALTDFEGMRGEALACAIALEHGDMDNIKFAGVDGSVINDIYIEAIKWADEFQRSVSS
ncbi:MAG: HDOD domain-containing protein [Gammaproteobacteria bacterium]|nr:HDOD domain-containing protein [Gammaproteobacteria bacterium]